MIVIVASRWDSTAEACAARWADYGARVLTVQDLSVAGWRQRLHSVTGDTAIVGGEAVPQQQITGVLTLLRGVSAEELIHIIPRDRAYVAAEMTAFLLLWLSRLTCPVLNRPTPACLSGPHWRPEKWVRVAVQSGITVLPVRRLAVFQNSVAEEKAPEGSVVVTVVGSRSFGDADPALHHRARLLAGRAGVGLVQFRFSGPQSDACFIGADTFPSLTEDWLAHAALEYLRDGAGVPV